MRAAASLLLIVACSGCVIGQWSKFTYRYGAAACEPGEFLDTWCIVEVAEFGYLGIGAGNEATTDKTFVTIRLVPRTGVVAAWSSAELEVVHLQSGKRERRSQLETTAITGGDPSGQVDGRYLVGYGRKQQSDLALDAVRETLELRFPPVMVGGKLVPLAPVQVHEAFRTPVPFIYHSH